MRRIRFLVNSQSFWDRLIKASPSFSPFWFLPVGCYAFAWEFLRRVGRREGKDLFFQTYFKPQESPTVFRTSIDTVQDSSENCGCSSVYTLEACFHGHVTCCIFLFTSGGFRWFWKTGTETVSNSRCLRHSKEHLPSQGWLQAHQSKSTAALWWELCSN